MNATATPPLIENEHILELLSLMRENNKDTSGLFAMINRVTEMEKHLETAVGQLADMKRDLHDMREIQDHPIKTKLQKAIIALEQRINDMRESLAKIKVAIVEGAKNALDAFKEKGANALNNIMRFFHIKQGLQAWKENADATIRADTKTIANIEAFSQQYHETGKGVRNMGRALRGKEAVTEAKPVGWLAKTLQAPFKAHRATQVKMKKTLTAAIKGLEQMEQEAAQRKAARAPDKPSLLDRLEQNKALAAQHVRPTPVMDRAKNPGVAI